MKSKDEKRALFDAVTGLEDDLITEAAAPKIRAFPKRMLRIAACLAVIIGLTAAILWPGGGNGITTGPGILAVAVHASEQKPFSVDSPETVVPYSHRWHWPVNWAGGWPITLSVKDAYDSSDNISFHVTVDGGGYYVGNDGGPSLYPGLLDILPAQFTVPNNTTIFWDMTYDAASGEYFLYEGTAVYTTIIVYDGSHIIGYTVLKFSRLTWGELGGDNNKLSDDSLSNSYQFEMTDSVSFPKVNGEYQNITLEYVNACIKNVMK